MKVLVIRAEYGRIVESNVVDGEMYSVVKEEARRALEAWRAEASDFVVARDYRDVEISLPVPPGLYDELRELDVPLTRSGEKAVASIPVVLISYDSEMISEEDYQENKIILVAPYLGEDARIDLESEAASMTGPAEKPEGISEGD